MVQERNYQLSSLLYARKLLIGTREVPAIDAIFYSIIAKPLEKATTKSLRRKAKRKNK